MLEKHGVNIASFLNILNKLLLCETCLLKVLLIILLIKKSLPYFLLIMIFNLSRVLSKEVLCYLGVEFPDEVGILPIYH